MDTANVVATPSNYPLTDFRLYSERVDQLLQLIREKEPDTVLDSDLTETFEQPVARYVFKNKVYWFAVHLSHEFMMDPEGPLDIFADLAVEMAQEQMKRG
jgi:hypothetical protein